MGLQKPGNLCKKVINWGRGGKNEKQKMKEKMRIKNRLKMKGKCEKK
jgi:hypothetical protein